MKQLSLFGGIFATCILVSCSGDEEPAFPVFMQPSSIVTTDADGDNQTFEYDDYGRIVAWTLKSNGSYNPHFYSANYSYPDGNTIKVTAQEAWLNQRRNFEETIVLQNGRASKSEGTFIFTEDDSQRLRKTYRLEFAYLPTSHLNVVKHAEVVGIGDDLKADAWDKAWTWENYLIWEDGNLKEYQDFNGKSSIYRTTKYDYLDDEAGYPVIVPIVINNAHHMPLMMQGVFGRNSENLVKSAAKFDENGNYSFTWEYAYQLDGSRVSEYTETVIDSYDISNPISYKVNWTAK